MSSLRTTYVSSSPDTFGDSNQRDLYARHKYQRANGDVVSSCFTLSGSTAYETVTQIASLPTNTSPGTFQIFVKPAGSSTTSIDRNTVTPRVQVTPTDTTINNNLITTGSLTVGSVTLSQSSTNFNVTLPTNGSVTDVNIVSSSGTNAVNIANAGDVTISNTLTVNSDLLATSDLYVTGDSYLYGDLGVDGDCNVNSTNILIGGKASSWNNSGIYIGANRTSPQASLLYKTTSAFAGTAAFQPSVPVTFAGTSSSAELGSSVTVYSNDKTNAVTVNNTDIMFNSLWRLRYDSTNNRMVFENRANTSSS